MWDGAQPQLVLGARPGLGHEASKALKPDRAMRERAFRFVLATTDVVVIASTPAEREHWLLALRALPAGQLLAARLRVHDGSGLI